MNAPSPSWNASKLIARIWHGVTEAARADEYADYLERTGARECRATPGNRGVYVLRRINKNRAEFTFISLWESVDAIRRFAGDDYEKAHYYPEDRDFLLELELFVEHYDVLAAPAQ
ncbi:MAG TPA: antibiotic biosynthesis monooxygenase [Gemmatimonadales bacterium]|nr:antibiotic biosynthesis monooxygenase [Gemmatimonadales bacterium]